MSTMNFKLIRSKGEYAQAMARPKIRRLHRGLRIPADILLVEPEADSRTESRGNLPSADGVLDVIRSGLANGDLEKGVRKVLASGS